MISIGTQVFHRIVIEARLSGLEAAKKAGVRAIADTMQETSRFSTFERVYVEGCAADRLEYYLTSPSANSGNQVIPGRKSSAAEGALKVSV